MVAEMSYQTCSAVLDSWELVRNIEQYEEKVGVKLFTKFFEIEPDARRVFGFRESQSMEELLKSRRFYKHAGYFVQMLDKALGMLGPDIEMLTEVLLELGKKHVSYGVKPEFFPSMGQSLVYALQETLGKDTFDVETKDSWVEVYGALSYDMIRAQKM
ncbi:globin-like protein [Nitzschia inconspicua]|uniref:Globin-like protein n=1 Tax=Nitzschia inconspicua TaxID=303405 RepID=A0A9K3P7Y2_9STRA|nr:globin-like protein [Nitzschia inconspicua]KAG7339970.1 globin-like protein [Nitzschia inconspicua]